MSNVFNVGILGAGISGLALAISLRKKGHEVTIYEKSQSVTGIGAGVQLSPNGMKVIQTLGLQEEIAALSVKPDKINIRNGSNSNFIAEIPLGNKAFERYSANFFQIHRSDLIKLLFNRAKNYGVRFVVGEKAVVVPAGNKKLKISIPDNKSSYDVIVGADGVHSETRRRFMPSLEPIYLKQVAYRATIPLSKVDSKFREPIVQIYLGSGKHAVCYPLRPSNLLNLVFCKAEEEWQSEGWNVVAKKEEIFQSFSDFTDLELLMENISEVRKWGLFGHKSKANWTTNNLALIGDACHPMLPYLAQGANQALEDAVSLSFYLSFTGSNSISKRLNLYYEDRYARVIAVQRASQKNASLYHLNNGVARFFTHRFMSFTSAVMPTFLLSRFDWLYGYDFVPNN